MKQTYNLIQTVGPKFSGFSPKLYLGLEFPKYMPLKKKAKFSACPLYLKMGHNKPLTSMSNKYLDTVLIGKIMCDTAIL